MLPTKIDQIALYASDPGLARDMLGIMFGMTEWVTDIALARGTVFGVEVLRMAGELSFNYQAGLEVEVLHYITPLHWHSARAKAKGELFPPPGLFVSHIGTHVDDMAVARLPYEKAGWRVAQEVRTFSHTNPYLLERGRTYHYVVWDSRDIIGYDLKLIQRIEAKGDMK